MVAGTPSTSTCAIEPASASVPVTVTGEAARSAPSAGESIVTAGAAVSTLMVTESVVIPPSPEAVASKVWAPSASSRITEKLSPVSVAGTPLTETVSVPWGVVAVPVTATPEVPSRRHRSAWRLRSWADRS